MPTRPPSLPSNNETQDDDTDLWFLPPEPDLDTDLLAPLPRAEPSESTLIADWAAAEAANARRLAEVAARFGALDDRLSRGPEGWRHRLALLEASEMGWIAGVRVVPDRLALWVALRLSSVQEDTRALQRTAWAFRRLSGGAGPDAGLAPFLGRQDSGGLQALPDRLDGWIALMAQAQGLHPFTRAAMGLSHWPDEEPMSHSRLEGAVVAARIAATAMQGGAMFTPLAMGGGTALRAGGAPGRQLRSWLDGIEDALRAAMRMLDRVEAWEARANAVTAPLSGRTPARLITVLRDWPMASAPMAEALTGASRATVQRNLAWFEAHDLTREVTGQGRFRFWRAAL